MSDDRFQKSAEQAAAFQKLWMESMAKIMQAAFTFKPDSPPPEILRQIRGGIFQALAQSWDEYMRSPQFLEGMKQWMDGAIAFRKMTNDFMAKVRNDAQSPSRDDIDNVMLTLRHMEKRLLDRLEVLEARVNDLPQILGNGRAQKRPGRGAAKPRVAKARPKPAPPTTKPQTP